MTTVNGSGAALGPELALLQAMIENDYQQERTDREAKLRARSAMRDAMVDELEAMKERASATRTAALVQGGMTMAGAGMTTAQVGSEGALPALEIWGSATDELAAPAGKYLGTYADDAAHDEKAAAHRREQASWRADDAQRHEEHVEKHSQAVLSQLQGILEAQHATTIAVLSNA